MFRFGVIKMWLCLGSAILFPQITQLQFTPDSIITSPMDSFLVEINVMNVTELRAYTITASFSDALLECMEVQKGSFLGSGTFFYHNINNTLGHVQVDEAILGNTSESGSGTLFILKFYTKNIGEDKLRFINFDLRDPRNNSITATADSATIHIGVLSVNSNNRDWIDQNTNFSIYPNPFNSTTVISYSISEKTSLTLNIFDINGKLVNTIFQGDQNTGEYFINWDGKNHNGYTLASGIYFVNIKSGRFNLTKRVTFLK